MSEVECIDYIEQIVYLVDDELDETDIAELHLHLRRCAPCSERYDLQRAVKGLVARSCCESAPAELRQRVLLQLREVQVSYHPGP